MPKYMTINVQINKVGAENTMSVLRKFSRRVQSMGLVRHMRSSRYRNRPLSDAMKKKQALKRIEKRSIREQLIKDGKISDQPVRGRRR